jgi:hypothetical protein
MAIADNRQRYMPLPEDRSPERGQTLAYPEAVLLVHPVEPEFEGEVSFSTYFIKFYWWVFCLSSRDGEDRGGIEEQGGTNLQ